jgi:cardiolipin synthase
MVHVKLLIVDGLFVSVGSGNFDNRSIQLNDEANLDVLNRDFAAEQTRLFELDKKQSDEMTLDKTGSLHLLEKAADLASPEL